MYIPKKPTHIPITETAMLSYRCLPVVLRTAAGGSFRRAIHMSLVTRLGVVTRLSMSYYPGEGPSRSSPSFFNMFNPPSNSSSSNADPRSKPLPSSLPPPIIFDGPSTIRHGISLETRTTGSSQSSASLQRPHGYPPTSVPNITMFDGPARCEYPRLRFAHMCESLRKALLTHLPWPFLYRISGHAEDSIADVKRAIGLLYEYLGSNSVHR